VGEVGEAGGKCNNNNNNNKTWTKSDPPPQCPVPSSTDPKPPRKALALALKHATCLIPVAMLGLGDLHLIKRQAASAPATMATNIRALRWFQGGLSFATTALPPVGII
jgi:hypothetical protein